jgi:hypothetical protein
MPFVVASQQQLPPAVAVAVGVVAVFAAVPPVVAVSVPLVVAAAVDEVQLLLVPAAVVVHVLVPQSKTKKSVFNKK